MMKYINTCFLLVIYYSSIYSQSLSVTFSKSETICGLGHAKVSIISGAQPITILWSTGATTNSIDQLNPGDYSVKVKDNLMNDSIIYFTIDDLVCEPSAENHFTPNSDNYNDTWSITRLENFPEFDLSVYNRWGQLVHHQYHEYIPWDGRSLNIPLPDATYYYILFFSKSKRDKYIKGDVTIIR